ncbi:hypothetical protein HYH02_003730 [Chlamydomonas schloesseri]|uniref:Uncharacterized protein n=1 Tax=Chlamydomonas schloesseri TaxID=2026947 RepID=A0A836B9N5_9CHLO|nr:hypothetical protein HYH02_003730 [Chlamydomonas schloesseri]|eukprot:KAG2451956.1 hypothetical protein HYH02_003730 [Chlamydomonas schloesseri]
MGKRRREDVEAEEPAAEAAEAQPEADVAADTGGAAQDAGAYEGAEDGVGGRFGRRNRSQVNPETLTYLEEVVGHFQTLVDDEERSLLVGNVLDELAGKEVKVGSDPVCSRHVETLMASAQAGQLLRFLTSVSDVDGLFTLVSNPFGSHVVEKLLMRLETQLDAMSSEEYDEFVRVMTLLADAICPHLYDYATDRFATHVVRRLLCLAAGRNVLPPAGKPKTKQQQDQALPGLENKRRKGEALGGLAAKLGPSGGGGGGKAAAMAAELLGAGADEAPPARLPELVAKLVNAACGEELVGAAMGEMVYHPYACPLLQALLRAAASDRKLLRGLVPVLLGATSFNDSAKGGAGAVLEGCKDEEVEALFVDPTASHLVEALLQVLPKTLAEEFIKRFMVPRLADLAHHPSANFTLQAALAAAPSKDMAKALYEGLSSLLPDLLRKRRSGVVAALAACLGRHGVCQRELCAALGSALGGLPQWAHLKGDAALAPALLCLDSVAVVGSNEPFAGALAAGAGGDNRAPRLSAVGCSILIQVLRYGQGACRAFTDSVAGLQPHDAARVGADPSGSRVLEALLEGNAPAKVKAGLLRALAPHWELVASTGSGAFLVEAAYRSADVEVKEAIASRLAASHKQLEGTHWGPQLMSKVGASAYARDPEQWRRHAASASKTLDAFAKMFGDIPAAAGGKGAKGKAEQPHQHQGGSHKAAEEAADGPGPSGRGGGEQEEGASGKVKKGKKDKKQKKRKADDEEQAEAGEEGAGAGGQAGPSGQAALEAEIGADAEEEEAGSKQAKKKKKRAKEAELEVVDEGTQAAAAAEGKKAKKKKKDKQ